VPLPDPGAPISTILIFETLPGGAVEVKPRRLARAGDARRMPRRPEAAAVPPETAATLHCERCGRGIRVTVTIRALHRRIIETHARTHGMLAPLDTLISPLADGR
jgi:hypothetical protein